MYYSTHEGYYYINIISAEAFLNLIYKGNYKENKSLNYQTGDCVCIWTRSRDGGKQVCGLPGVWECPVLLQEGLQ